MGSSSWYQQLARGWPAHCKRMSFSSFPPWGHGQAFTGNAWRRFCCAIAMYGSWPLFNGRVKGKRSGRDRSRSHLHPHEHGPGAGPCASPWEMGSLRCHQEVRCAAECPGVPVLFVLLCTEDGWWHLLALGQERDKQG